MKESKIKAKQLVLLLSLAVISSSLFAGEIATEQVYGDITLTPIDRYDSAGLRISGDDYEQVKSYESSESINMDLQGLSDGIYTYELTVTTGDSQALQSGRFRVINGYAEEYNDEIEQSEEEEEDKAMREKNSSNDISESN